MPFGFGRKERKSAPAKLDLRGRVLKLDPAEVGTKPTPDLPHIWAMLVDIGIASGVATVVAFADGTTSLYTSTGGGVIGAGSRPAVRAANRALLRIAEAHLDSFSPSSIDVQPRDGEVSFVVLTYDGPRRARASTDAMNDLAHPLTPVWEAANEVIHRLGQVDAAQPPGPS